MDTAFIDAASVNRQLTPALAIAALERAFVALDRGEIGPSHSLGLPATAGSFHVKACASTVAGGIFVAKVNANFPGNPPRGLPTIQGVIAVFDAFDGRVLAMVDSGSITNLRTAAATMLVVQRLAREGAKAASIVGCGAQGAAHARLILDATPIRELRLFDDDPVRAARLAGELGARACAKMSEATIASDVVITCTPSTRPFLGIDDVKSGTLVPAVGSDNDHKLEVKPDLLAAARLVTDSTAQCEKMGELKQRLPGPARICGELVDVVAGRIARTRADEVVVFDSTGMAVEDLALCAALLGR
ncbi:MAG TPA: ornithine cyclodeaminase family protein [Usitatibacter sp.]|nr:ornithine cyclodeaminase family protein [Usitatibacter sp.]